MPQWFTVRTPKEGRVAISRAPFNPATSDALVRAARQVRRGRFRPSARAQRSVYVVLLDFGPDEYGLYVGMTGLTPDERFQNHKAGHKDSRWVRRFGVGLLPALYRHLNPLDYEPAKKAEVALAEALASTGVSVKQG